MSPSPSHRRWSAAFHASWAIAAGAAVAIGAQLLLMAAVYDSSAFHLPWLAGGALGAVVGLVAARATRERPLAHVWLRRVGAILCGGGVFAAISFFGLVEIERPKAEFLVGLVEFLLALLSLAVAAIGVCLLVAGVSGPRALAPQSGAFRCSQ